MPYRETSAHVVLLGDSIFDNAAYVPGQPAVIEQLRSLLSQGSQATLLAVDAHTTDDVVRQMHRLPNDATHLVVSIGGNDALQGSSILYGSYEDPFDLLRRLAEVQEAFAGRYQRMLRAVLSHDKPTAVCTIYDAAPNYPRWQLALLAYFNDVIVREAVRSGVPLIDLRVVCGSAEDYSSLSPIEPSVCGGAKIAAAIARMIQKHDFLQHVTAVYV